MVGVDALEEGGKFRILLFANDGVSLISYTEFVISGRVISYTEFVISYTRRRGKERSHPQKLACGLLPYVEAFPTQC